ncbi:MAG: hypothetical protein AAFO77_02305 [Pseudomonadota bacterium]
MIIGTVSIDRLAGVLNTSDDSYPLDGRTTFSALRPFRVMGWMGVALLGSFAIAFHDLLWMHEIGICVALALILALMSETIAQLVLSNRDLRGSDLSVACWGTYAHLNRLRRELSSTARALDAGEDVQ